MMQYSKPLLVVLERNSAPVSANFSPPPTERQVAGGILRTSSRKTIKAKWRGSYGIHAPKV
jgi:hypothetical protein